ncbi:hypothetical protein [Ureibacillus sinduriensis]|nr:hypothetical protein [Ureibacillus sinduriensis]
MYFVHGHRLNADDAVSRRVIPLRRIAPMVDGGTPVRVGRR